MTKNLNIRSITHVFTLVLFVGIILLTFNFFSVTEVKATGNCPAPLYIYNVQTNATTNSATITWTTNISATSEIEYWLNARNPTPKISVKTIPSTNHSITIPTGGSLALSQNTIYSYKVTVNASGFIPSTFTGSFSTTVSNSCNNPVCISNVVVSSPTQTSVVVTWTTNVPATSVVEYGPTTRYGLSATVSGTIAAASRTGRRPPRCNRPAAASSPTST